MFGFGRKKTSIKAHPLFGFEQGPVFTPGAQAMVYVSNRNTPKVVFTGAGARTRKQFNVTQWQQVNYILTVRKAGIPTIAGQIAYLPLSAARSNNPVGQG